MQADIRPTFLVHGKVKSPYTGLREPYLTGNVIIKCLISGTPPKMEKVLLGESELSENYFKTFEGKFNWDRKKQLCNIIALIFDQKLMIATLQPQSWSGQNTGLYPRKSSGRPE